MNEIKLSIIGDSISSNVEVDGKLIHFKKDKFGIRNYTIQSENENCELKIYNDKHELDEKFWWLFSFLFYLISIFGIFNTRYNKNFYTLSYSGKLDLTKSDIKLQFLNAKDGEKALNALEGEFEDNETNIYGFSKKAKFRRKLCLVLKIVSWFAILIIFVNFILK